MPDSLQTAAGGRKRKSGDYRHMQVIDVRGIIAGEGRRTREGVNSTCPLLGARIP